MSEVAAKKELFERMPVSRAAMKLALPSVIGQIILVIYNMADTFFVGLTGSEEMISAVTVCMPSYMFLSAIANLFGAGGASVISRALGESDIRRAGQASAFSFCGCTAVSILYCLAAWIFRDGFVNLLGGTDPVVHRLASVYLLCTVAAAGTATALGSLLSHLVRSEGRSFEASAGIVLGGLLNIALDPLFMFVILPEGNEVLGAALATALSNIMSLAYFMILLARLRGKTALCFRPRRQLLESGVPGSVLYAGLPACLMTLCENISYAVLDKLMSFSGITMQAGIGVAKKVNMLAHSIVRGISQGILPLIGYNYSSGDHRRMRSAVRLSLLSSTIIAGLCTCACLIFGRQLVGIFIPDGLPSLDCGVTFLRILCIGAPFSACAYACISFFQATGHGLRALLIALFRKGLIDIPLMFILRELIPVYGIVVATPATDIMCSILAIVLYICFIRRTSLS